MIRKLFTGLLLGAAATGFGQIGSGMPQTDYMPAIFLNPAVAQDMHLSQETVSKEQNVLMQEGMALMPFLAKQKANMSAAEKKKVAMEMVKAYEKMSNDSLAPLTPAQRSRYKQLSLQFFGPMALAQPKNQSALGMTAGQKSKLISMLSSTGQGMAANVQKMRQGGDMAGSIGSIKTSQAQTRASQEKGLKAILTPAQMAKWNAMQGRKLSGISNLFGGM